jgi:1,4-dihydroxy-2-naphthoyl-CoA synthase
MNELKIWEERKSVLMGSINAAIEKGSTEKEVLEIMREMLEHTRPRKKSMEDYLEDLNND